MAKEGKVSRLALSYFQERKRLWLSSPRRKISELPPAIVATDDHCNKKPSPRRLGTRSDHHTLAASSNNSDNAPKSLATSASAAQPFPFQSGCAQPQDSLQTTFSSSHGSRDIPPGGSPEKSWDRTLDFGSHTTTAMIPSSACIMPASSPVSDTKGANGLNPTGSFPPFGMNASSTTSSLFGEFGAGEANTAKTASSAFSFSSSSSSSSMTVPSSFSGFPSLPKQQTNDSASQPGLFSNPNGTTTTIVGDLFPGTYDSHRDRLVAFYQKHNPEKLGSVGATLEKYRGREEELFTKLSQKYATYPKATGEGPMYVLDTTLGRIVVRVFANVVPLAAANFGSLCMGQPVPPANRAPGSIINYKNTPWHRVVPGQLIQGGDTTVGDGTGGRSAFDRPLAHDMWGHFSDEKPFLAHDRAGLLSMANTGKNSNSSQFFITCKALPHLNGKHVVFGGVIKGTDVVEAICALEIDENQRPKKDTRILDCGPFGKSGKKEISEVDPDTTRSFACEEKKIQHPEEIELLLVFFGVPRSSLDVSEGLPSGETEPKKLQSQDRVSQVCSVGPSIENYDTVGVSRQNSYTGARLLVTARWKRQPMMEPGNQATRTREHGHRPQLEHFGHGPLIFFSSDWNKKNDCASCVQNGTIDVKQRRGDESTTFVTNQAPGESQTRKDILAEYSREEVADRNEPDENKARGTKTSRHPLDAKGTGLETDESLVLSANASVDSRALRLFLVTGVVPSLDVYTAGALVTLPQRIFGDTAGDGKRKKPDSDFGIGILKYGNAPVNAALRRSMISQAEFLAIDPMAIRVCVALMKQRH